MFNGDQKIQAEKQIRNKQKKIIVIIMIVVSVVLFIGYIISDITKLSWEEKQLVQNSYDFLCGQFLDPDIDQINECRVNRVSENNIYVYYVSHLFLTNVYTQYILHCTYEESPALICDRISSEPILSESFLIETFPDDALPYAEKYITYENWKRYSTETLEKNSQLLK